MRTLISWPRYGESMDEFRNEMESMFHRFFGKAEAGTGSLAWTPRVDLEEGEKELLVKVDLPGVEAKDVEISVAKDVLTIKGERKEFREDKKKDYHKVERFVGKFFREIALPAETDADKVTAEASRGVITIRVPKKPAAGAKKVLVEAKE